MLTQFSCEEIKAAKLQIAEFYRNGPPLNGESYDQYFTRLGVADEKERARLLNLVKVLADVKRKGTRLEQVARFCIWIDSFGGVEIETVPAIQPR